MGRRNKSSLCSAKCNNLIQLLIETVYGIDCADEILVNMQMHRVHGNNKAGVAESQTVVGIVTS
jgi:hypothetical protein